MPRIIAIIEARMASTRLPGKVLCQIGNRTAVQHLIDRLRSVAEISDVIVATTTSPADHALVAALEAEGTAVFRGSELDVLGRVAAASATQESDYVVSVTADCPLLDPHIIRSLILIAIIQDLDFVSNSITRSFPDGMECTIVRTSLLTQAAAVAVDELEREHTSLYLRRHLNEYASQSLVATGELYWPELGITLDTESDLRLLREIVALADSTSFPTCREIVRMLRARPDLVEINRDITRKSDS